MNCVCAQLLSCASSSSPMDQPIRLLCPWNLPGKNTGVGCHSLLGDLPDPGIEPTSPALVGKFFATEPPGKPSNELSTSQMIFTVNTKVNYITINPTTFNEILCQEELLQGYYKRRSRVSRVEWQHEKSSRLRGFTLGHCQSRALGLFQTRIKSLLTAEQKLHHVIGLTKKFFQTFCNIL